MFSSTGTLHYEWSGKLTPPFKLVLNIDQSLADYYHASIPKAARARKQAFRAHISVVRKELADPAACKRYHGEEVSFEYEHLLRQDSVYWWIDAYSHRLEAIRAELGLPNAPLHPASYHTPMPVGYDYTKRFHITIGNTKQLQPQESK